MHLSDRPDLACKSQNGLAVPHDEVRHEFRWQLALWLAVRQTPPRELSPGAKLCWDVIARYEQRGLECWAGLLRMAHQVGVTESQASRYIRELVKKGYIRRALGQKGKPVYARVVHPDLDARASRLYEELSAKDEKRKRG